jgi:hypothetical protein
MQTLLLYPARGRADMTKVKFKTATLFQAGARTRKAVGGFRIRNVGTGRERCAAVGERPIAGLRAQPVLFIDEDDTRFENAGLGFIEIGIGNNNQLVVRHGKPRRRAIQADDTGA